MYTVYMHTFPNGKKYIGVTGQTPERRWNGGKGYSHQKLVYRAILKYGWDNITHTILFSELSKKEAYAMEKVMINKYDTTNIKKGYNNSIGGEGGSLGATLSDEVRKHISEGHIGLKHSEETKKKISDSKTGNKNPNWGKTTSEETKEKQKKSFQKTATTIEYKEKMSEIRKSIWEREDYREKQSARMRGENNYFYGKHFHGQDNPRWGAHLTEKQKEHLRDIKSKPILCVETGVIYTSTKVAECIFGVHGAIYRVLDNPKRKACGYHWRRIKEDD